jgi:hypothetical protein
MPKLFALQAAAVSQQDLENILSLTNQIARLREMRDHLSRAVLERVLGGAEAELGPRTCETKTTWTKGAIRKQKLVVR